MKILNIEDFFHPNAGYQINIIPKYLSKFGHDVTIVTSEMDKVPEGLTAFFGRDNIEKFDKEYEELTGVKIIRLPIKCFFSGRAVFTKELKRTVDKLQPDVLYVHGNDTLSGMKVISKLGKLKYALISDSHMLEMASTNKFNKLFRKFYRVFITPKIIKYQMPVIRTQDDAYVEKCLGIPLKQAPWISYGSDTMLFHPGEDTKRDFRKKNNISDEAFVILYAGKLDEAKGGLLLADAIKDKFSTDKEVVFVIVGNTEGDYGKKVEDIFARSKNRILRFPTQRYVDLAQFYQSADLAVFPRQCSLSFYDVQACALPVLSEDNNINVDRCSHDNGWNFKAGDVADFRAKIEYAANMSDDEYKKVSDNSYRFIMENYNYEDKAREYERILLAEYKKFKDEK